MTYLDPHFAGLISLHAQDHSLATGFDTESKQRSLAPTCFPLVAFGREYTPSRQKYPKGSIARDIQEVKLHQPILGNTQRF